MVRLDHGLQADERSAPAQDCAVSLTTAPHRQVDDRSWHGFFCEVGMTGDTMIPIILHTVIHELVLTIQNQADMAVCETHINAITDLVGVIGS